MEKIQNFEYKGKKYYIGIVNTLDGQIEETYTFDKVSSLEFSHLKYCSPEQIEKIKDGENVRFFVNNNEIIFIDKVLDSSNIIFLTNKINEQIIKEPSQNTSVKVSGTWKFI